MARLASQEKLGYYKTPKCIVEHIKTGLSIGPNVRMLDPCCGTGEALQLLAQDTDAQTLGIELEYGRYEEARKVLDQVLLADALAEAWVSSQSVDLLWLNPPYDIDDGFYTQYHQRLEVLFLHRYVPVLAKNGVMIFIIPLKQIYHPTICGILARFTDLDIFKFSDDEFEAYKQVVVMGRKRLVSGLDYEENFSRIMSQRAETMPTTDMIRQNGITVVASENKRDLIFNAHHIDPAEILPLTTTLREMFLKEVTPPKLTDARPLMPLRQGHLAMLLAAGYVNGELKDGNGEHLVIKGAVRKMETVTDESTMDFHITKTVEKVQITVRALNLSTGQIETVS